MHMLIFAATQTKEMFLCGNVMNMQVLRDATPVRCRLIYGDF